MIHNIVTDIDGKEYKAVKGKLCRGCAFSFPSADTGGQACSGPDNSFCGGWESSLEVELISSARGRFRKRRSSPIISISL